MTKNITLAIDDEVLRRVRHIASQRHTSVNSLVRAHLEALARDDDERERERQRALAHLRTISESAGVRLGNDYNFTREDAYAERLR